MKMNLSMMTFATMTILTIVMSISSNNILFMWMCMEMNFISFMPMLTKSKKNSDHSMKYLIIQSCSSSIMLMSIMMNSILETPLDLSIPFMMSMLMKMGMMPTHLWMPNLLQSITWLNCILMMTVQKIIPTIISTQIINFKMMLLPMVLSLMMGPITGMKQLSLKKLMAYSSISNSPWMLSSAYLSSKLFFLFMMIYSIMNMMTMNFLNNLNLNYLNQMKTMKSMQKINLIILMLTMSGMPPLLGFLPKWMILNMLIKESTSLVSMMILSSMLSTYMYMKLISMPMMLFSNSKKMILPKMNLNLIIINSISTLSLVYIMN